jgi:LysM repeat protein
MSSKIEFDLSSMSRRDVILVIISVSMIVGVIVGVIIFLSQGKRPVKVVATQPPLPTASQVAAVTPSPNLPPTLEATAGPSPTLEPYSYTVKKGETLFAIIQFFGYRDLSVVPELLRLNNMASENTPLREGQTLLIPRQTPTPGPSSTPTIEGTLPGPTEDYSGCSPDKRCTSPDGQYWIHEVRPGDTILSIAVAYNSRKQDIFAANGLSDTSFIVPGQKLSIPILVTLTPTLTPTGGPDSTGTPTPTLSPPSLLAPPNNMTIARGQPVILQWTTIHALEPTQSYLILVTNMGSAEEFRAVTRTNTYHLPDRLQPGIGQSARFEWQILVITGTDSSATPVSGLDVKWAFTWGP